MFLGHYALALGARRAAPRASLGTLVAATQFLDLLWPVLLLMGVETVGPGERGFLALRFTSYPWSHSLLMTLVWAGLFGAGYYALRRDGRTALLLAMLVASHWVLDYLTHVHDLPLWPGGTARVGLGMWHSTALTVAVEGLMTVAGVWLYLRGTRARDRVGSWGLGALGALLLALYASNLMGGAAPTDMRAVAWGALGGWLVVAWAAWGDRHRVPVMEGSGDSSRAAAA